MRRTALALVALVAAPLLVAPTPSGATSGEQDPPLTVPQDTLDAALHCSPPFDDTREPVLLVHGTFTNDDENYGWNYRPHLQAAGYDVCSVTLPNRSLDDIQVSSEYVVDAVRDMAAMAGGRQVDILGHSQGGLQPRWVTRWYPATRALIDDVVTLAAPHHGTEAGSFQTASCEACLQMGPDSRFIAALNSEDETPGDVDYTSLYTTLVDELVVPEPAASTLGGGGANVVNIGIQDVCPGRPVDHLSIVSDAVVHELVLDAFGNDGPAGVSRAAPDCLGTFFPTFEEMQGGQAALEGLIEDMEVPAGSQADGEPATAFYADGDGPTFTDVPESHPSYWEIEWAATRSIATGTGGTFDPQRQWNRAQATMWLWRMAGSPTGAPDTSYPDVPPDAWYHDGLDWADAEGIVLGFDDGTFRPRASVTRGQLAWWLWSFAGQPPGAPEHPFVDVREGAWYEDGLDWVAAEGVVRGLPGNRYQPRRFPTRAAVATALFRLDRVI